MTQSFAMFYATLIDAAKAGCDGKAIGCAIVFETENEELREWLGTGANPFFAPPFSINDAELTRLKPEDVKKAQSAAIERHEKDMKLVRQNAYEHTDVGYSAILKDESLTVTYFDVCSLVETTMGGLLEDKPGVGLSKPIGRLTVVLHSLEGASAMRKAQRNVVVFVRDFLDKNNLGTPTPETEWNFG